MLASIIGTKSHMTQVFTTDGRRYPATKILAGPCKVVQVKTADSDGYQAVQLAYGSRKSTSKPIQGHLKKHGVESQPRIIKEFTVKDEVNVTSGQEVTVETVLQRGDVVAVTGVSKGKGFAGGVKRYGFHGGPKTHGQSDRTRAPGSIGAGTTPGRVYKGKHMAGRMGGGQVTIDKLVILHIDPETNSVWLSGSIPGARNSIVTLTKVGHTDKIPELMQNTKSDEVRSEILLDESVKKMESAQEESQDTK